MFKEVMSVSRIRSKARLVPGYALLSFLKNVLIGGDDRRTAILRWRSPSGLLQPSGYTEFDRYPDIFSQLTEYARPQKFPKILSFGCSTGDEIATVLKYFPTATVKGIDIDSTRIADCMKRFNSIPSVSLICASSALHEPKEEYDIVLAMAVLRHGDLNDRFDKCTKYLAFENFTAALKPLLETLKPGGLFVSRHSNFRVLEAANSASIEPLMLLPASGPIYDRDNHITQDENEFVMFRKRLLHADSTCRAASSVAQKTRQLGKQ